MSALKGVYVTPDVNMLITTKSPIFPLSAVHSTRARFSLQSDIPEGAHQYVIQTVNKLTIGAIYLDDWAFPLAHQQALEDGLNLATMQLANMGAA